MWYSYQKSSTEIAIVRECFSTSVLLGSITDPIVPSDQCVPKPVEDASIMACICTNDFCNGMDGGESAIRSTPRPSLFDRTSTKRPGGISARPPPRTPAPRPPPRNPAPSPRRPGEGVLCHSCGSLFGQEECPDFDPANPSHQKRCSPGEACLWYSWQKSSAEVAMVRECFSPSILLGPISNPLTKKSTCIPQDIAETPGSRYDQRLIRIYSTRCYVSLIVFSIDACLCDTDLCHLNLDGKSSSPRERPRRPSGTPNRDRINNIGDRNKDNGEKTLLLG